MRREPSSSTGESSQPPTTETGGGSIIARHLSKHFAAYGHLVKAVDDVTVTLAPGQLTAILGPSGGGKTTLLSMLGALEQPSSGQLTIAGNDVATMSRRTATQFRRSTVGFVFQSFHLIPNLSALENVALPMALAGVPSRTRNKRARDLLDQVEIGPAWHRHRPKTLSGGQQQRVALARALANDPPVLLADEPTGNLDTRTGQRIIDLLSRSASAGRTVVLVTHNEHLAEIAATCIELEDGRIVNIRTGLSP
jgi:putative ABC transport system ATP-binding protein